ncbi:MAG: SIS domain-containing protein [Candidatus Komeilibacteria bacterium]
MQKLTKQQLAYNSIDLLTAQIDQGWAMMNALKLPVNYQKFTNIVVCGMGGSQIGFAMIGQALSKELKIPVYINNDYNLPSFVDKKSLIILSSYSGTTEEVLSCTQEVIKRGYHGLIITSNGLLARRISKSLPGLKFSTDFNPSQQPRLGLGYSVGIFLSLLNRIKAIKLSKKVFAQINLSVVDSKENQALAKKIAKKMILVVSAEHLAGNAHILSNQINESGKNQAYWANLPELNHHFLESLSFPQGLAQQKMLVLFLESASYSAKIQRRIKVTKMVFKKQGIGVESLRVKTKSDLQDSLSTLQLGAYLCYYISVANGVDPLDIPWVDYFKKELKK